MVEEFFGDVHRDDAASSILAAIVGGPAGARVYNVADGKPVTKQALARWIVEQALQPGMSLAGLAMGNQVNANQLRRWVQLHGKRGDTPAAAARLLPVMIAAGTFGVIAYVAITGEFLVQFPISSPEVLRLELVADQLERMGVQN